MGVSLVAKTKTTTKRQTRTKKQATPAEEVKVCRRRSDRRRNQDESTEEEVAATETPTAPEPEKKERRKVQRRRQIDPTTCERDYTDDEIEFMHALDEYKRANGRMFPTCSEILEVVRKLGYVKTDILPLETVSVEAETESEHETDDAELVALESEAL